MIYDLFDSHEDLSGNRYDFLIVGTGPAGIVVAKELLAKCPDAKICILESGRKQKSSYADKLKAVVSDKLKIRPKSRERVLGGASTTWNGLSAPLEPICLAKRSWLGESYWPVEIEEMTEYYEKASVGYRFPKPSDFQIDPVGGHAKTPWQNLRQTCDLHPDWDGLEEKIFLQAIPIQRFASEHAEIFENENLDLVMDASVKSFKVKSTDNSEQKILGAIAMTSAGREIVFQATHYVLSAGGIENARILLNSPVEQEGPTLGNEHDQVGRYMMNHPKRYQGILVLEKPVHYLPYYFGCMWAGFSGFAGVRLSNQTQHEQETVSAYLRFVPIFPWAENPGVEAFVRLMKKSKRLFKMWVGSQGKKVIELKSYAETGDTTEMDDVNHSNLKLLQLMLKNPGTVLNYAWHRLTNKRPLIRRIQLRTFMEMEPSPDNRVKLSSELDCHGFPIPQVTYAPTARDQRSVELLTSCFAQEIKKKGIGTVEGAFRVDEEFYKSINKHFGYDASHHMGATRMGTSPLQSVVDPTLRVHSVSNLYVAGSSVFPTSGLANPTMTIVALSIRLADHLANKRNKNQQDERVV